MNVKHGSIHPIRKNTRMFKGEQISQQASPLTISYSLKAYQEEE